MTSPNTEAFNVSVALILARLYESFPAPLTLSTRDLDPDATPEALAVHDHTIAFLEREGFLVRSGGDDSGVIHFGVVLSTRGLALLKAVPESLSGSESVGERLVQIAKDGGVFSLKTATQQVLASQLPALLKYLPF